jgi:hypothetical protein
MGRASYFASIEQKKSLKKAQKPKKRVNADAPALPHVLLIRPVSGMIFSGAYL